MLNSSTPIFFSSLASLDSHPSTLKLYLFEFPLQRAFLRELSHGSTFIICQACLISANLLLLQIGCLRRPLLALRVWRWHKIRRQMLYVKLSREYVCPKHNKVLYTNLHRGIEFVFWPTFWLLSYIEEYIQLHRGTHFYLKKKVSMLTFSLFLLLMDCK